MVDQYQSLVTCQFYPRYSHRARMILTTFIARIPENQINGEIITKVRGQMTTYVLEGERNINLHGTHAPGHDSITLLLKFGSCFNQIKCHALVTDKNFTITATGS